MAKRGRLGRAFRLRAHRNERYSITQAGVLEIMDTAPRQEKLLHPFAPSAATPVLEVEKCLARKMGLNYYVDLHIGVDANISVRMDIKSPMRVKAAIKETEPRSRMCSCTSSPLRDFWGAHAARVGCLSGFGLSARCRNKVPFECNAVLYLEGPIWTFSKTPLRDFRRIMLGGNKSP